MGADERLEEASRSRARAARGGRRCPSRARTRRPAEPLHHPTVPGPTVLGHRAACDNPAAMGHDDRFDDLIASLGGFHRSWLVYLGLELGPVLRGSVPPAAGVSPRPSWPSRPARTSRPWTPGPGPSTRTTSQRSRTAGWSSTTTWPSSCSTTTEPNSSAGSSSTPSSPRMDWGGMADFFRTGTPIARATRPLPRGDRTTDAPGHRGLLPGGTRGPAAARRGPVTRGPRRRHPLRRWPLARRDGPPVPGARARGRRVRGRFGRPGRARPSPPKACPIGSTSARRRRPNREPPASSTWRTSSTRCTSSTMRDGSSVRPGRRCIRAAGCSSSTGRFRRSPTSSGRVTARSSPGCSSTRSSRAPRWPRVPSSSTGSRALGCRHPRASTCPQALRCSSWSDRH